MKIFTITLLSILAASMLIVYPAKGGENQSSLARVAQNKGLEIATFAGGCFWCMEPSFEKLEGVKEVVSGYTGGIEKNPTYGQVSSGGTGHAEAVRIIYDPAKVTYSELLDAFWRQVNPTDPCDQFVDRGKQYKTAIFYHNDKQRRLAAKSRELLDKSGRFAKPIVTEIKEASEFHKAQKYHQDYYKKNPYRYRIYRYMSGRDRYLEEIWGGHMEISRSSSKKSPIKNSSKDSGRYTKPSRMELKKMLTSAQYRVTQENGTEMPFMNKYWNNKQEGIYVDIVSGEPLFSSTDKFDSGTGWPSFTKPLEPENIVEKEDENWLMTRTEIRSKYADSHLGHVFSDGPQPTGLRYCINSVSLRFIPKENLKQEGYGKYLGLFEDTPSEPHK